MSIPKCFVHGQNHIQSMQGERVLVMMMRIEFVFAQINKLVHGGSITRIFGPQEIPVTGRKQD